MRKRWIDRNIGVEKFLKGLEKEKKEVNKLEIIEKKPGWEKIYNMVSEYLQKNLSSIEMPKLERKLKDIFKRKRFLDVDEKEIKLTVAKSLLKFKIDRKKRQNIENEIIDMIINEIRREL